MAQDTVVELGQVIPTHQGEWNSTRAYNYLDAVSYNGSTYVAAGGGTAKGDKPGEANVWQLVAKAGAQGPQGIQGIPGPKGDPGEISGSIGGRNLLLNSAFLNGFVSWNNENNSWTIDGSTYQGNPVIKSPTTVGSGSRLVQRLTNQPAGGSKIMVSFNAKGNDANSIVTITLFGGNEVNIPLTSSFSRYTISLTVPTNFNIPQIYFWNGVDGNNVFLNSIKVEIGNVPTDWTPAPEDVVQKSGGTMTGNLTAPQVIATDLLTGFHNVIQVPTTTTKIIDLINNEFIKSRGFWKEATYIAYNTVLSDAPTNDAYSIIKLATRGSNRTYVEYSDLSGNVWHTTATTNSLQPWVKQANDSEVVHNTGNETIAGDKSFTGNTTLSSLTVTGDVTKTMLTYNSGFSGGNSYYYVRNKVVHMYLVNVKGFTASGQRAFELPSSLVNTNAGPIYFQGMYNTSNALVGFNGTQVYISTSSIPYSADAPLTAYLSWMLP